MTTKSNFLPGSHVTITVGQGHIKHGTVQRISENRVYVKHFNGEVIGYKTELVKPAVTEQAQPKLQYGDKTLVKEIDVIKQVLEGKTHTVPKTEKEKDLADMAHPKGKITHKDVLVARGVLAKEEEEDECDDLEEANWGYRNSSYDDDEDVGYTSKRAFKRKELEFELRHEKEPSTTSYRPAAKTSNAIHHNVPFAQRDQAKKEGMKWDPNAKKWYHTSQSASDASKFPKTVKEEVELDESLAVHGKYTIRTGPVVRDIPEHNPEHVVAHNTRLKKLGVVADAEPGGGNYGSTHRVTVTNNETNEKTHHHVYQSDLSGKKAMMSVRGVGQKNDLHGEHNKVIKDYLSGKKATSKPVQEEVELEEAQSKTQHPYHAGYDAHGQEKTRQHNPYKEGSEGAAQWAKGWEHASDGKPRVKFTNEEVKDVDEGLSDIVKSIKNKIDDKNRARLSAEFEKRKQERKKKESSKSTSYNWGSNYHDTTAKRGALAYNEEVELEEEQIDELSKSTLNSYTKKANDEVSAIKKKQAEHPRGHISGVDADKKLNRQIGINQATKRIVKKDLTGVAEEVDLDEGLIQTIKNSFRKGMKSSLVKSLHPDHSHKYLEDIVHAKNTNDLTAIAKKAKDAGHLKSKNEEVELDEAMSSQQRMDFNKMLSGAMGRDQYNAKWKTPSKSSSKQRSDVSKVVHGAMGRDQYNAKRLAKEEAEQIDEMTQGKSYTQKQIMSKVQSGNWEAMSDVKPGKHVEMRHHTGKKVTVHVKEEVELDENYRILAQKGIGAERKDDIKVGHGVDYYHPKDGSKHMGKIDHMDDKGYTVKDDKTGEKHKFEYYRKLVENTEQLDEGMISYSEFKDKIAAHRKAGNKVVDDKYTDKKATYTTIDRDGAGRKVTHTPQGSKQEHLGNMKGDDDTTETQTAEKRGRGRPAGSKSGARR